MTHAAPLKAKPINPTANTENALEVEHLQIAFGPLQVLKDINLKLKKGENLVVLGRSGSGKSVLIKCLVGLNEPDEGKITLQGKDVSTLKDQDLELARQKIGFLFQGSALYDSMTIRENLEFPLMGKIKLKEQEINALVEEALGNVGLLDAIDKMPSELSGGMRKRIGLARTLISKPEIMFYDEPTTGLDSITSREISHLILEMQKKYNTSSIIITHDLECARITGNRVLILKDGIIAAEGTYEEIKNSKEEWISTYFQE
ncbi:MAG: ATP-binding cassette domain-containing protein [bacterium]|nr:ATP-binding cassette domain-containing protein [bacterium]